MSYTTNNRFTVPTDGADLDTWGIELNTSLAMIDAVLGGRVVLDITGLASYTLTTTDGAVSDGNNAVIYFTGTPSVTPCPVTIAPNTAEKTYLICADATTLLGVTVSQGSGSTVTVNAGCAALISCDGAGATAAVTNVSPSDIPGVRATANPFSGYAINVPGSDPSYFGGQIQADGGVYGATNKLQLSANLATYGVQVQLRNSAPTDGNIPAGYGVFYLDEAANNLKVRVKYADGITLKTATIALV